MTNIPTNRIPSKFCIDSFKLSIDLDKLKSHSVPENFILVCKDSGEILQDFKKCSLPIDYNGTKIYIGVFRRILRKQTIEKLMLIFSSKVAGAEYFSGIKKHHVIDVLLFLQEKKYIDFNSVEGVYKNIFAKDVDVKRDFVFRLSDREKIKEYNKKLEDLFQHEKNELHTYAGKENLGLQAFGRNRSTLNKPFLKFYDKSRELTTKHQEFFASLPEKLRQFVQEKFVYRFEFTMRDKTFFEKFEVSNRLEDVFEILHEKWKVISVELLNANFVVKIRKPKKAGQLNYYENVISLLMFDELDSKRSSMLALRTRFTDIQPTRNTRRKAGLLFDRVYLALDRDKIAQLRDMADSTLKYHQLFGIGVSGPGDQLVDDPASGSGH